MIITSSFERIADSKLRLGTVDLVSEPIWLEQNEIMS